ncbi:MAG: hypothetical protein DRI98_15170, partial [Bacteroidetes bacterium]
MIWFILFKGGYMTKLDLEGVTVWRIGGDEYTREDLRKMDPVCLRALFRERIHHTVEVEIYPIMLGRKKMPENFGYQAELLIEVCNERGFNLEDDDFQWGLKYIELARRLRAGANIEIDDQLPVAFTDDEMKVVRKLLWARRSVRDWVPNRPIPDEIVEQLLEAGRAAPNGCNLDIVRFIVIKDKKRAKWVWSDIPTPMNQCVLIVICYDARVYETVGHDKLVSHNQGYDAAAA